MKIDVQARMLAAQAMRKPISAAGSDTKRMKQTARDFEAIFVQQIFKGMRKTVPEGGLLPRGQAEDIYADLQDMEAAKQFTKQGGIGLAEMMFEQMRKSGR
jgi:flagellar protein FlgJ